MPESHDITRSIVLAASGTSGSAATEEVLARVQARGWDAVIVDDPSLAMAELCLEDRTQSARAAWGLRTGRRLALVLVPPVPGAADVSERLIEAVRRYLPAVSVWLADGARITEITPAAPSHSSPIRSEPDPAEAMEPAPAPELEPEPVEITRDEIAMLFADADDPLAHE